MQCNLFNEAVSWLKNFFTGIFFQETIKILKVIITEVHLYSQWFYIIFSFDFYKNVHLINNQRMSWQSHDLNHDKTKHPTENFISKILSKIP